MTAPETLEGWYALHDLRLIDRAAWSRLSPAEREKAASEAADLLAEAEEVEDAEAGASVTYGVLGHKADLLILHLRPDPAQLYELERRLDQTSLAACSTRAFSYLSVVEISRHGAPEGTADNIEASPYIQSRLYPQIPEHDGYICFYPMDKRRQGGDNWYMLGSDERGELMRAHGRTGRRYAGKVSQIVTGSMGLDDWEWGVTLFSDDPLQFKKLVYEMRFDEVSARFAEFGPFFVGRRLAPAALAGWLR
ncbi:MAG: hydrogen peroxide-dependent heme synthase [Acidimicrobiia bacterium]